MPEPTTEPVLDLTDRNVTDRNVTDRNARV
jgi:hypothetical protein